MTKNYLYDTIVIVKYNRRWTMKEAYIFDYVNENEFKKLERSIKKYNMLAYKKLYFEYYPSLRNGKRY